VTAWYRWKGKRVCDNCQDERERFARLAVRDRTFAAPAVETAFNVRAAYLLRAQIIDARRLVARLQKRLNDLTRQP
jgi:hypothetical protein